MGLDYSLHEAPQARDLLKCVPIWFALFTYPGYVHTHLIFTVLPTGAPRGYAPHSSDHTHTLSRGAGGGRGAKRGTRCTAAREAVGHGRWPQLQHCPISVIAQIFEVCVAVIHPRRLRRESCAPDGVHTLMCTPFEGPTARGCEPPPSLHYNRNGYPSILFSPTSRRARGSHHPTAAGARAYILRGTPTRP